jgi:HD-GYP domain-containing protein (c-di-GMP phosphodiesterase class II)
MKLSLKELAIPVIKSIDSFNFLLKSHHRRTAVIAYHLGKEMKLNNDELFTLIVAAALHDVGALSIQERDSLIVADVDNPMPHCTMGYRMLSTFEAFTEIAKIILHHHVKYEDGHRQGDVLLQSYILHLADRVDILISKDEFILSQKKKVTEEIRIRTGSVFHPEVSDAFEKVAKADIFWIEINSVDIDQLFKRIKFSMDFELTIDNIVEFSLMLSRIIDFRSKFTASHSYTVGQLGFMLGERLGWAEIECKKIMVAGYLHDIGKLGIDPELIEKNGPLTEDEYNQMKLHAYYTGQILNELSVSEWFADIVAWAERHHEKEDGSGYPYALDDKSLDEKGKIVTFCDIISALIEERPYRKGMPIDACFELIDEKMARSISSSMFTEIKKYKSDINSLVQACQRHTSCEYDLAIAK